MQSVKRAYCEYLNTDGGAEIYRAFQRIVYARNDSLVARLNNHFLRYLTLPRRETLRACDIGGGDGHRIARIIEFLHREFGKRFHLDFIEQSKHYIDMFDAAAIGRSCETTKIHNLFENVTLPRSSYDLVFLIHSIFAFSGRAALSKVLSLRNKAGKIIIISNAPGSFLGGLKKLVDEEFSDERYEVDGVERDLQRRLVLYDCYEFQTTWSIEPEGRQLDTILEWISLGRFKGFDSDKKRAIYSYIDENGVIEKGMQRFVERERILIVQN